MKRDQGVGSTITQTLRDPSLNIQNNVRIKLTKTLEKPNDPKVVKPNKSKVLNYI